MPESNHVPLIKLISFNATRSTINNSRTQFSFLVNKRFVIHFINTHNHSFATRHDSSPQHIITYDHQTKIFVNTSFKHHAITHNQQSRNNAGHTNFHQHNSRQSIHQHHAPITRCFSRSNQQSTILDNQTILHEHTLESFTHKFFTRTTHASLYTTTTQTTRIKSRQNAVPIPNASQTTTNNDHATSTINTQNNIKQFNATKHEHTNN